MSPALAGGCHCGAVRFAIVAGGVIDAGYCHCGICRHLSGAPVAAWVAIADGAYAVTAGTPATYRSSPGGTRDFCPACGSQLLFRSDDGIVTVSTTAFDTPADPAVVPQYHIHVASRLPWFDTADTLPRLPAGPDSQG